MAQDLATVTDAKQLAIFAPTEITRPDINIGKMAGVLFSSPWAKDLYDIELFTSRKQLEGETIEATVTITPLKESKRPTTTSYKIFLGLVQMWEQQGKVSDGVVSFSYRQLARVLEMRWGGENTAKLFHEHIRVLMGTTFDWKWMFTKNGILETRTNDMSLLDGRSSVERKDLLKSQLFTSQQKVRINAELIANMRAGHTKPVNYLAYISIKDSCARLYTLLDLYLSKKNRWERRSMGLLFDELEMEGERYKKRNIRHQKLKEFVEELNGKELSTGTLILKIDRTVDGEDYKLVAIKAAKAINNKRTPLIPVNSEEEATLIADKVIEELARLGSVENISIGTLKAAARSYSRNMMIRAIGELKSDYRGKIKKSPIKAYMYILHKMVHQQGKEWIRGCNADCPYRVKNIRIPNNFG